MHPSLSCSRLIHSPLVLDWRLRVEDCPMLNNPTSGCRFCLRFTWVPFDKCHPFNHGEAHPYHSLTCSLCEAFHSRLTSYAVFVPLRSEGICQESADLFPLPPEGSEWMVWRFTTVSLLGICLVSVERRGFRRGSGLNCGKKKRAFPQPMQLPSDGSNILWWSMVDFRGTSGNWGSHSISYQPTH